MEKDINASQEKQLYAKIPNVIGLYRHTLTGKYYGQKKIDGKRREKSLGTTDRKIAERRLKAWMESLSHVDLEVEKTTLKELFACLLAVNAGKSESTRCIIELVRTEFLGWWPYAANVQVRNVRPSQLEEWLALMERRVSHRTYNRYAGVLKQAFELAVKDRVIASSPFDLVKTKSKKPSPVDRRVPTREEFEAIVQNVRSQPWSVYAEESADFLEFLGLAGVGQAEASSLCWDDVDMQRGHISFRRHKTDVRFRVPIYEHLKPLLDRLLLRAGSPVPAGKRVFKIRDAKKALTKACVRLGLPHFSQRNLRQCLIRRLWQCGVDRKLIAKWQGHQDGGQLILNTYTEVFGADDEAYEHQQLAKLGVSKPRDHAMEQLSEAAA